LLLVVKYVAQTGDSDDQIAAVSARSGLTHPASVLQSQQ
jgi:hypothetical protein